MSRKLASVQYVYDVSPVEEQGGALPYSSVDELLVRASGKYSSGSVKEGIVVRTIEPVYSETICAPLSFKVINNDYLLKKHNKQG